jgi:hypothetical protein
MRSDQSHALVIGIANYDDEVGALPEAVLNDARDMASVLESRDYCGFLASNVRLVIDNQATLNAIRASLADLALSAGVDDTVVIFFSGHGTRLGSGPNESSALLPIDCQIGFLEKTTLPEAEFTAALAAIKAKRLMVLIDACHAGGAGHLKGNDNRDFRFGFDEKSLHRLAQGSGRVIIASSRASETSIVLRGERNSVFTGRLLEALKGKALTQGDGLIRVFEVFNYVSEQVKRTVPGEQHPIFKTSDLEDNFPVALDRGGSKVPRAPLVANEGWHDIESIMADLYPTGPTDQAIWSRAGGDISRLALTGTGRANWFTALRTLKLGGGGKGLSLRVLIEAALDDYPQHAKLLALRAAMGSGVP